GVNVPIYSSTLAANASNPIATVGLKLQVTDAFALGGNATINLSDGRLLSAGGELSYRPERLFGWDTHQSVFVSGSYSYDATSGGQSVMLNLGVELGDSGALRSVDVVYQNLVLELLLF